MCFQALGTQSVLCSYPFEVSIGHFLPQKRKAPVFLKDDFLKDILFFFFCFILDNYLKVRGQYKDRERKW